MRLSKEVGKEYVVKKAVKILRSRYRGRRIEHGGAKIFTHRQHRIEITWAQGRRDLTQIMGEGKEELDQTYLNKVLKIFLDLPAIL